MSLTIIYIIAIILGALVGGVGGINSSINKALGTLQFFAVIGLCIYVVKAYTWIHILGIIGVSLASLIVFTVITYKFRH